MLLQAKQKYSLYRQAPLAQLDWIHAAYRGGGALILNVSLFLQEGVLQR
jgi:hypothetical protein